MGNQFNFTCIAKNLDSNMLSPENPDTKVVWQA